MAVINKTSGKPVIDYMSRDYDSLLRTMQGMVPYKLPEWTDYQSEADFGNVLLELFAHMGDILSYYQDRIANESFLGTARERSSIIHHLNLIGYRLATASPASASLDITVAGTSTGTVTVKKGNAFATKSSPDSSSVSFEYTGEKDILIDFDTIEAVEGKKTFSGIPVEEGRTVIEEIGRSDGTPNQRFPLLHAPLILRSPGLGEALAGEITLTVQSTQTTTEWNLQNTLAFSSEEAQDFFIEIDHLDQAIVIFGDGNTGAIPETGAMITATYRVGGGSHGNVNAGAIDTIIDAPELVLLAAQVSNPIQAVSGSPREEIDTAVKQAPQLFRTQGRAVTAEDYKSLALNFNGVGKVQAKKGDWNTVKLFVAPDGGGLINDVLKNKLQVYFAGKSPMATVIEILDVDYVKIYIRVEVGLNSYYANSSEEIQDAVRAAGTQLLAFDNVDFGQTLYLSKYYEAIESVEGVAYVTIQEFSRQNIDPEETGSDLEKIDFLVIGKFTLSDNEIPVYPSGTGEEDYENGIKLSVV
jgi:Baseplate J-like protein